MYFSAAGIKFGEFSMLVLLALSLFPAMLLENLNHQIYLSLDVAVGAGSEFAILLNDSLTEIHIDIKIAEMLTQCVTM